MQVLKRLVALACLAIACPSLAVGEGDQSPKLEEVVVTAQKREENLQNVPVPVTAIDARSLSYDRPPLRGGGGVQAAIRPCPGAKTTTIAPILTRLYRSMTSSLVMRMQPEEIACPIYSG